MARLLTLVMIANEVKNARYVADNYYGCGCDGCLNEHRNVRFHDMADAFKRSEPMRPYCNPCIDSIEREKEARDIQLASGSLTDAFASMERLGNLYQATNACDGCRIVRDYLNRMGG